MSLPDLERKHKEIIGSIQNTQNIQKYLYNRLDLLSNSPGVKNEVEDTLNNISNLKKTQEHLYKSLNDLYNKHSNLLGLTKNDIDAETLLMKVADDELKQLKYNHDVLQNRKMNKERMVELNTYEQKRYHSRIVLAKLSIYTLASLLAVMILQRLFLPNVVARSLYILIIVVGLSSLLYYSYDNMRRDDFDFDKYQWGDPPKEPKFDQTMFSDSNDDSNQLRVDGNCKR